MGKAILFVAVGLILLGGAGLILFPNVRTDILQKIPFFGGGGSKPITLVYWGLWEPREVIQPLLDEYQQQNPNITVQYEMRDPRTHWETVKARLGSEGSPDIVRIHSSWVPLLQERLLALPADIMNTQQFEETFYPVNQSFVKQDDKYYGLPLMVDGLALVYNRSLFAEEGVANPPKTWNEFRDMAARLTKKNSSGALTQSGAALGVTGNVDYFADILGLMFAQNGVQFADASSRVTFHETTSPIGSNLAQEALSFYILFATSEKSWDATWANSTEEFSQGRVAMVLLPSHRLHEVLSARPAFEVGVTTAPQLPTVGGQAEAVNWANYWVESVSRVSPNGKAAWKFVKWLAEKDQQAKFYRLAGELRSFGEPYARRDLAGSLSADPYTLPYAQQGDSYTTWFFTSGTFNGEVNDRINNALGAGVEALINDRNADAARVLNNLAQQTQQILDAALK